MLRDAIAFKNLKSVSFCSAMCDVGTAEFLGISVTFVIVTISVNQPIKMMETIVPQRKESGQM